MLNHPIFRLLCLGALLACDADTPCDPGQRFEGGWCVDGPAAGGAGGWAPAKDAGADDGGARPGHDAASDEDAGAQAGSGDAPACPAGLAERLGVSCETDATCGCGADYCAVQPGQRAGYCTVSGCTPNGDDCPAGYDCFDLSALGVSGFAPFCVRS